MMTMTGKRASCLLITIDDDLPAARLMQLMIPLGPSFFKKAGKVNLPGYNWSE
jgi:hypothetical protein